MSFSLHVWDASASDAPCDSAAEIRKTIRKLLRQPPGEPNPKFSQLTEALYARFAPDDDEGVWVDGSEGYETRGAVLGFGLRLQHADFDAAYFHTLVQANRLGLNVWDGQGGCAFLADGRTVPADEGGEARVGFDAWLRGDWPLAHSEYRRLAASGSHLAIFNLGRLFTWGLGHRPHRPLGAALQHLGATTKANHQTADKATRGLSEADELATPALVDRLRSGPLLEVVDAVLAEQARRWEEVQREMSGPVDRSAGVTALLALAATGHEEAAHWVAVACAKGARATRSYTRCTGFTEMAARFGHAPSKQIVAEVSGVPEGATREYAIAERCLLLAKARGETGVDEELARLQRLQAD
jgi:hypothetical protein